MFKQVTSESLLQSETLKYQVAQKPQQTTGEQLYVSFWFLSPQRIHELFFKQIHGNLKLK